MVVALKVANGLQDPQHQRFLAQFELLIRAAQAICTNGELPTNDDCYAMATQLQNSYRFLSQIEQSLEQNIEPFPVKMDMEMVEALNRLIDYMGVANELHTMHVARPSMRITCALLRCFQDILLLAWDCVRQYARCYPGGEVVLNTAA